MASYLLTRIICATFLIQIPTGSNSRKIIWCGHMLDVRHAKYQDYTTVIVDNNRIAAVKSGYMVPGPNDTLVDLRRRFVLPGLIDMHVHIEGHLAEESVQNYVTKSIEDLALQSAMYAKTTLLAGFTTVRDAGGSGANVALRKAIDGGIAIGPRIKTARVPLKITGGHGDETNGLQMDFQKRKGSGVEDGFCNGIDSCREAVRWQIKNGADWIKVMATGGVLSNIEHSSGPSFSQEELLSIVQTARDHDKYVAVHAHGKEGMIRAIKAGVHTIEHCTLMDAEVHQLMKKYNVFCVPTMTGGWTVAQLAKQNRFSSVFIQEKALATGSLMQKTVSTAYKSKVPLALGSDAGVFAHGENAKETYFMTNAGIKPMEVLQIATLVNSWLLRMDKEIGAIEVGKLADIIAVAEDPLHNIKTLQNVKFIMKDGTVYKNNKGDIKDMKEL